MHSYYHKSRNLNFAKENRKELMCENSNPSHFSNMCVFSLIFRTEIAPERRTVNKVS